MSVTCVIQIVRIDVGFKVLMARGNGRRQYVLRVVQSHIHHSVFGVDRRVVFFESRLKGFLEDTPGALQ